MVGLVPTVDQDQSAGAADTFKSRAAQACVTCRKQKRRCDKLMPSCSRCASLQRICDYSESGPGPAPTSEDFAALQSKLNELEGRLKPHPEYPPSMVLNEAEAHRGDLDPILGDHFYTPTWNNRFPSVFFLDSDVYKAANTIPPIPEVDIPMDVLDALSSDEVIQEAVSTYFNTIHKWFSFISRKRMNLGITLAGGGPDLTLLLLAIKLVTTPPPPPPQSADKLPLYWTTKHFLHRLEVAGTTSILYLQSQILVALYEYAHAIYPSAYLSVGACVRYASLLGLPSYAEASAILGPCTTWTETEERRRTWWATHILDRIVSLGSKRPFAGGPAAPPPTEFLPTDDAAWDAGDIGRALQRPLSTPVHEPTNSPFARLAQAAVLISKAMAHCRRAVGMWNCYYEHSGAEKCRSGDACSDDTAMANQQDEEGPVTIRSVTTVVTELDALSRACQKDMERAGAVPGSDAYFGFLTARCVSWSTAIMVLDLYSCPEHMRPGAGGAHNGAPARSEAELALQVEAINGLRTAGLHVRNEARILLGLTASVSEAGDRARVETQSVSNWTSMSAEGESSDRRGPPEVSAELVAKFSPLCLDMIYCGMSTFGWLWRENGDPEMKEGLNITRQCLERFGTRWKLACEYLEVGKKQDGLMMELMDLNGAE
ncbi:hypothetical protein N0V93_003321 [Gnomoniopsis smithogilvyi]|uniref:Zn(2)-C6 fungal-type domain-containing protein n=1 Tax=Gnomoniopsis smithogilvyi TaxID=1191159 RepID=A0A9W8YY43_9PEZI|nr:hypothetical protein N0V93_003321 [Gnomoniopsis smithogilvyi]